MSFFSVKSPKAKVALIRLGGDLVTGVKSSMVLQLDDLERHAVDKTQRRLLVVIAVFFLMFLSLPWRLIQLSASATDTSAKQIEKSTIAQTMRPRIMDRNNILLATYVKTYTLGANPKIIDNPINVTKALVDIFPDLNAVRVNRLLSSGKNYVALKRGLSPRQYHAVLSLGNPGLKMESFEKRVYPHGGIAAHVLGFVSSDRRGLRGLERALDMADKDAPALDIEGDVVTTLDLRIQHAVRNELQKGVNEFGAIGGAAIVMNVHNGNVVALVSLPDFDPNHPMATAEDYHFNRATQGRYELGSVFKVFTAAMALEEKAVSLEDVFQTSTPLQIGKYTVKDFHGKKRALTTHEIVTYSSNIGSAQLALAVAPDTHRAFFERLGLLSKPYFELPETIAPQVPSRWNDLHRATMSYGHGISVSLLQTVAACASMINGGIYYEPRLTAHAVPTGKRVISSQTSLYIREMMRAVVTKGTASRAEVAGFPVLGKTGTAEKSILGGYDKDKNITSFMGAFPAYDPAYAFILMLDEPKAISEKAQLNAAGWNVVPISAKIIERIAPLLGLMPEQDIKRLKMSSYRAETM